VVFTLPAAEYSPGWEQLIDTAGEHAGTGILHAGWTVELAGKSLLVLRAYVSPPVKPDHSVPASLALARTAEEPQLPQASHSDRPNKSIRCSIALSPQPPPARLRARMPAGKELYEPRQAK
jgi:isoamylase